MFELIQLRQLLAIAERGTMSAAAEELNLSQPSLTRSIQRLEEELGLKLFDRKKNRVELNEAGRRAVEQAKRVLGAAESMRDAMCDYARSLSTISIGSCAPAPIWELTPRIAERFPDMTITSEMRPPDALLSGLLADQYQLVVMDAPVEREGVICREYVTERLFLSLPRSHPLTEKEGIYLSELSGQTMLLYSDLGIWHKLKDEKMGDIHFIVQTEREAFSDLISASALPNFTSNLSDRRVPPTPERVDIPILDEEAAITFYLCLKESGQGLLDGVFPR